MATFIFCNRFLTRRDKAIAVLLALVAFWSSAVVSRAQGADVDDEQVTTQIAATHTPSAFGQPVHAEGISTAAAALANEHGAAYGLRAFWAQSDLIARGTLICLALMFIGASYVLIRRSSDQQGVLRNAQTVTSRFWTAPNLYEAVRNLESRSAFRAIAEHGLEAATHREGRLTDRIGPHEWIAISLQRSVGAVSDRLRHGLGFLRTVGSTAPFIGLFGTVWGIHRALAGASGIDELAAPIGAALVATAVGLGVAVLAMLGCSWLTTRNHLAIAAVRDFADDVQAVLLSTDVAVDRTARISTGSGPTPARGSF